MSGEVRFIEDVSRVVSVWSAYGHRFMSSDSPGYEVCLTCGAMFRLVAYADEPWRGEYVTAGGGEPMECSRDTTMVHGYPGEREGEGWSDHDCNCLFCDS